MTQTRQQAAEQTRLKIIQAAFEIVGESGYEDLTTNSLIAKAGIAKGTLYHHFNNLDEVVYAMIKSLVEQSLDGVPVEKYDSLAEYLEAMGEYLMSDCINDPKVLNTIYGFIPKGMKDPKFKKLAVELLEGACDRITPAFQRFYGGKLTNEKIDHAIRMVDMFVSGFCIHYVIFEDKNKYQKLWSEFSEMLVRFLEK
ncbi:TetR/AcrR family transcriptional regulator [Aliikangiella coralliicola]|uniref:TetR/AcrR family transcriptional regulator n=1 Tax=Aliikangiella coralliicola TaxID=2592383 RepID=A0A545U0E6_9GAMM|nr:TetR/AcrR family transcriptional regulator [Aliikangiella coralliicola]TQV82947.1 TetR/AcrR family transcriptional regulator [Aliikangiella coralliicola]